MTSKLYLCLFIHTSSPLCCSLGHKHRHKRQKAKRRAAPIPSVAPLVGASILDDLGSLSASLTGSAWLRSEHGITGSRPSNDSSGDSGPHRRSKRFLSYPRFVEVMLVADSKMVEHHGSNLQHYILTLMSIVSVTVEDWFVGKGWLGNNVHCKSYCFYPVTSQTQT